MSKIILYRCLLVSLIISLIFPFIMIESFTSIPVSNDLPDWSTQAEFSSDELITLPMRKMTMTEQVISTFSDWYSFKLYFESATRIFLALLLATLFVSFRQARSSNRI